MHLFCNSCDISKKISQIHVTCQKYLGPVRATSLLGITTLGGNSVVNLSMAVVSETRINLKRKKNVKSFVSLPMIWVTSPIFIQILFSFVSTFDNIYDKSFF